jgi:FkbM family methyltransferase
LNTQKQTNMHVSVRVDRFICSLFMVPVAKEYYCRIVRKLAMRGILENKILIQTSDNFLINVNKTDGISWRIYFTGFHERNIGALIKENLTEGDVFVDVGANIGYFTIMAAKAVGQRGRVISFEASPKTTKLLENNLIANQLDNVEVRNVAISQNHGKVKIYNSGAANIGQGSILETRGGIVEAEVISMPLDASTIGVDVSLVRLIKIDVEGAEKYVVAGMVGLLNDPKFNGDIILEIAPEDLDVSVEEFLKPFTSRGYKSFLVPNRQNLRHYFEPVVAMNWVPMEAKSIKTMTDVFLTRRR